MMSEAPTPSPPIIRAATRNPNEGARADAMAEIAYRVAARNRILRRPNRSLRGPETSIASVAVSVREETENPSWAFVSANSVSMNPTTPEITEASNPIRKPPSATISAVRMT